MYRWYTELTLLCDQHSDQEKKHCWPLEKPYPSSVSIPHQGAFDRSELQNLKGPIGTHWKVQLANMRTVAQTGRGPAEPDSLYISLASNHRLLLHVSELLVNGNVTRSYVSFCVWPLQPNVALCEIQSCDCV